MARLVVVVAAGGPAFVDALRRAWDAGDAVAPLDPRLPPAARAEVVAALRPEDAVEEGDALVVATSGTTGPPRGVVLTHAAILASALATSARLGVDPTVDRWLACLPLAHVGGLAVVTRAVLTGTALTVLAGFDAPVVEAEAERGPTLVSLVPTTLERTDARRFKAVVLGGSADWRDRPANVVRTYGMTETASGVVYDGVPLDGVAVRVVDGELQLRGPMLLRCYRDGTDPKDTDGWLATGDAGSIAPGDGRVTVDGRLDDVIVTGGEKVWPAAVEAVVRTAPEVAEVAVAGRPDPEWGQRVVAYVVATDPAVPPSLESLRARVKATLPSWAAPREVVLVTTMPRTAIGKVQRSELR